MDLRKRLGIVFAVIALILLAVVAGTFVKDKIEEMKRPLDRREISTRDAAGRPERRGEISKTASESASSSSKVISEPRLRTA